MRFLLTAHKRIMYYVQYVVHRQPFVYYTIPVGIIFAHNCTIAGQRGELQIVARFSRKRPALFTLTN